MNSKAARDDWLTSQATNARCQIRDQLGAPGEMCPPEACSIALHHEINSKPAASQFPSRITQKGNAILEMERRYAVLTVTWQTFRQL